MKELENKIPLIDADVIRYEIGHCCQYIDEETDDLVVRDWDFVEMLLAQRVDGILKTLGAKQQPVFCLTADKITIPIYNRWLKNRGRPPTKLYPNYREEVAVTKPYKGNRYNEKPAHYENITAWLIHENNFHLANGVEADDIMATLLTEDPDKYICCSRDKDLRQVPGWHFGWECGKQGEWGPELVDRKGKLVAHRRDTGVIDKVTGTGELFLLYQILVGDVVDNIPGCKGVGKVKAFNILTQENLKRREAYEAVLEEYKNAHGDEAMERMTEQARLVYLKRYEEDEWRWPYDQ